jgi:hypothetical protein
VEATRKALGEAIEVIQWCGRNDKTPTYTYDRSLKTTARRDGSLPEAGQAFNTPAEFARYWPERLLAVLNGSNSATEPDPTEGLPPDLARILCDPMIIIDRDHEIRLADGRTLFEHIHEWQNAPSDTAGTFPRRGVQSASEKERDDPNPAISPEEAK